MRYEPGPATRPERRRGRLPVSRTDNPLTPPTLDAVSDALTDPALALLEAARAAADAAGIELWAVGGALRDCAAGRPPSDLDAAIAAADPWAAGRLAGSVSDRLGRACEVTIEPRFGTASVRCAAGRLEIATLRRRALPTARRPAGGALRRIDRGRPRTARLHRERAGARRCGTTSAASCLTRAAASTTSPRGGCARCTRARSQTTPRGCGAARATPPRSICAPSRQPPAGSPRAHASSRRSPVAGCGRSSSAPPRSDAPAEPLGCSPAGACSRASTRAGVFPTRRRARCAIALARTRPSCSSRRSSPRCRSATRSRGG